MAENFVKKIIGLILGNVVGGSLLASVYDLNPPFVQIIMGILALGDILVIYLWFKEWKGGR